MTDTETMHDEAVETETETAAAPAKKARKAKAKAKAKAKTAKKAIKPAKKPAKAAEKTAKATKREHSGFTGEIIVTPDAEFKPREGSIIADMVKCATAARNTNTAKAQAAFEKLHPDQEIIWSMLVEKGVVSFDPPHARGDRWFNPTPAPEAAAA